MAQGFSPPFLAQTRARTWHRRVQREMDKCTDHTGARA